MTLPVNIAALAAQAAKETDYTQTTEGGSFERVLPEAGVAFVRLREYIEIGIHPHGRAPHTKDRPMARFVFELCHKKHQQEFEKDGEKFTIPHVIAIQVPISDNVSSDYIKIFSLLNYAGQYKHPLEALNQPMMCDVLHTDNGKEGKDKVTYANIWKGTPKDKSYTLRPPIIEADPTDPSSTARDISANIPALSKGDESIKAFLWAYADQAQWDSLFIEGTRTVKGKDGKEDKEVSKNWLQEKIKEAKNFSGSPIDQILASGGELENLPTSEEEVATNNQATDDALSELGL